MATAVYYCASSLDGYIAETDDSLEWLTGYRGSFDHEGAEPNPTGEGGAYEDFYGGVRALVMGSATYEWLLDHLDLAGGGEWPYRGKPCWVLSSRELGQPAVHVTLVPVVLGAGKPLFARPLPSGAMQLTGTSAFRNDMAELRYEISA